MSIPYHPKLLDITHKVNKSAKGKVNIVFNYNNTVRKTLVHNKTPDNNTKEVGVYEIPCKGCNQKYFGESGRGLETRISEHKRAYDTLQFNNALVKHCWDNDHRVDWNTSKILYRSRNVGDRRLVEGACINMGLSMEGNKAFTQEDSFIDNMICQTFLNNFKFKHNPSCTTLDTAAASSSPAQVTRLQSAVPVAGAYAVGNRIPPNNLRNNSPRRSRRLAGLPLEHNGIT